MRILLSLLLIVSAQASSIPLLETVEKVEIKRYLGKWYEIARFPNSFQENCNNSTANYSLNDDGSLTVVNTCEEANNQKTRSVTGIAHVADEKSFAKLTVNFVPSWLRWTGIGEGKYWIVQLEPNYQYAVVSEPERKYLWILSRTPTLESQTYELILQKLKAQHFDVSRIEKFRK